MVKILSLFFYFFYLVKDKYYKNKKVIEIHKKINIVIEYGLSSNCSALSNELSESPSFLPKFLRPNTSNNRRSKTNKSTVRFFFGENRLTGFNNERFSILRKTGK